MSLYGLKKKIAQENTIEKTERKLSEHVAEKKSEKSNSKETSCGESDLKKAKNVEEEEEEDEDIRRMKGLCRIEQFASNGLLKVLFVSVVVCFFFPPFFPRNLSSTILQ